MDQQNFQGIIFLCGFMGAGKTAVGNRLAEAMGVRFLDLDKYIEDEEQRTIRKIFESVGEPAFRKLEKKYLRKITGKFEGVVALGGGTLQDEGMLEFVKLNGHLVFIDTPFSVIFERILENKARPLLLNEKGELKPERQLQKELSRLYGERLKRYRQADLSVNPSRFETMEKAVDSLVNKIRDYVSSN